MEWVRNHGSPGEIDLLASTTDIFGSVITVGNTLDSNLNANILTTLISIDGTVLWQKEWDGLQHGSDYGTAVTTDNYGNIYVTGASEYSTDSTFDIVLLVYDWQGELQQMQTFAGSGKNNYPAAIALDMLNNIYITGTSENDTSDFDYVTLKYNPSTILTWAKTYNHNNNIDIAANLTVEPNGNFVSVVGGSEDSIGIWDYTTVLYDFNGEVININRQATDNADINNPKDIAKDKNRNYFVTCNIVNGNNSNIKIVKLDSTLNPLWTKVYEDKTEGSNCLATDDYGNVYIGGWQEEYFGIKTFLVLKYNSNGSLMWAQNFWPNQDNNNTEVTGIEIYNNQIVNVVGFSSNNYSSDIITVHLDANNGDLVWEKTWSNYAKSIDLPTSIQQFDDGNIFVTGKSRTDSGLRYVTIKYTTFERDTALVYDSSGNPLFAKHELITRFDPNMVQKERVDNVDGNHIEFGNLATFLKPQMVTAIEEKLPWICTGQAVAPSNCAITMYKIFRQLKTTDTISISRLGEPVPIPPFWATFVLSFPDGTDIAQVIDSFNVEFPNIAYAHCNPICSRSSSANDTRYKGYQLSLNSKSQKYLNGHINIEPAWNLEAGNPNIKIGIMDDGLEWKHEDFGYDGIDKNSSVVKDGWDFQKMTNIKSFNIYGNHGTKVAGIIGAVKNNNQGIAGIAGGNDSFNQRGVSLFGLRIFQSDTPFFFNNTLNTVSNAIIMSSIDSFSSNNYSYGLHISNNSWGFDKRPEFNNYFNDSNFTLLREAIYFTNRLQVTFVAGRGNRGIPRKFYPACIDSNWILCVGGTGIDGNYKSLSNGTPSNMAASVGWEIDIAAPATSQLIHSTSINNKYESFNGTSAATAHVSGVASLLMSYLFDSLTSYNNLAPEDIEFILEKTATDIDYSGQDSLTGHGRLNAGQALKLIKKPHRKLKHFGTEYFPSSLSINLYSVNDTIKIPERYLNMDSIWFKEGIYIVNSYKVNASINVNIASNNIIMYAWPRHSMSTLLPFFNSENILLPREYITLNNIDHNSASLSGFIYEVKNIKGDFLGWWPFDTSLLNARLEFSVLLHDINFSKVSDSISKDYKILVYPNPTTSLQNLIVNIEETNNIDIGLYDIFGHRIKNIYTGEVSQGSKSFSVDISSLAAGIYIYRIKFKNNIKFKRIIKK